MSNMGEVFRNLPRFKGKQRIAKVIFRSKIGKAKDLWVKGRSGCRYLLPNLVENVGFAIFTDGIYEKATSDFLASRIAKDGVFLDLGANIGGVSIPLYHHRKDLKIICVEASPTVFGYLEKSLDGNGFSSIVRINKTLFHTDGIETDFFSPREKFGKGSLSPVFTDTGEKVTTIKVDSLVRQLNLERVDFIKIDVEGYEFHVFKGAEALLTSKDPPDILFEFVDWAEDLAAGVSAGHAQRLLKEYGYRIFLFEGEGKYQLQEIHEPLVRGAHMLYATKNEVYRNK